MGKLWLDSEVAPHVTPWRNGVLLRAIDGDTFEVMLDLGFDCFMEIRLRLLSEAAVDLEIPNSRVGVDAWELRGEQREKGELAKLRVEELMPIGSLVRVFSRKGGTRDSFGRWLGVVLFRQDSPVGWVSIGDLLMEEGHAAPWASK